MPNNKGYSNNHEVKTASTAFTNSHNIQLIKCLHCKYQYTSRHYNDEVRRIIR